MYWDEYKLITSELASFVMRTTTCTCLLAELCAVSLHMHALDSSTAKGLFTVWLSPLVRDLLHYKPLHLRGWRPQRFLPIQPAAQNHRHSYNRCDSLGTHAV